jgi:hypothetical protein
MSERVGISAEVTSTVDAADDYGSGTSLLRLVSGERASNCRLHLENAEELRCEVGNMRVLCRGAHSHGDVLILVVRHRFEGRALIVPIVEVRRRDLAVA